MTAPGAARRVRKRKCARLLLHIWKLLWEESSATWKAASGPKKTRGFARPLPQSFILEAASIPCPLPSCSTGSDVLRQAGQVLRKAWVPRKGDVVREDYTCESEKVQPAVDLYH